MGPGGQQQQALGQNGLPSAYSQQFAPPPPQQPQMNTPNLAVLTNLLASNQITREQFNTFAHGAGLQQSQQSQQQQQQFQHQQLLQQQSQLLQQQAQGRAASPQQNPLAQFAHLPPIPAAAFQAHFNALGVARNMQQKMIVLSNSLQTGYLGGNGLPGDGGLLMAPEQRDAVTRELVDTRYVLSTDSVLRSLANIEFRRASAQIVAQCQAFVAQHGGPERINTEIASIQARRRLAPQPNPASQNPGQNPQSMQQQAQLVAAARNAAILQQQQQLQLQQQQQLQMQQMQHQQLSQQPGSNGYGIPGHPPPQPPTSPFALPPGVGVAPIDTSVFASTQPSAPSAAPPLHLLQTKVSH